MYTKEITQTSVQSTFKSKVSDYAQLTKLRLSFLVVLSAVLSFFLAVDQFSWIKFLSLVIGGFMVTGASNTFNQIIEKDLDKFTSIILKEIKRTLRRGERVELRGFGVFSTNTQKARISRNPKTGEKINTPKKKTIHFKMSKEMFKKLNDD